MPDDILAPLLDAEVAAHGSVRPPWTFLPGVHPYDIAWRMGAGEGQIMLWHRWSDSREPSEKAAVIRTYGEVPADWAWWAAEATNLITVPDEEDPRSVPFEVVRDKLAAIGIAVAGEPEE
jgi:hypothetical protein